MKRKRMKSTAFNVLVVILMQIVINVAVPIKAIAESEIVMEEIVTIQCEDVIFYNELVSILGDKILSKDKAKKSIMVTKTNVESVTSINIQKYEEKKVTNIIGIENFTNLNDLTLADNQISDISVISGLTNLTFLWLDDNQISDISAIKGLTNLTCLWLKDNQISDISAIKGLTNLQSLNLEGNQISDISAIKGLTNLQNLYLDDNQISDISAIKGLTNLTDLYLEGNQISDISAIKGLTNLTCLWLNDNQISDISEIKGMTNLTRLNLGDNQISDISAIKGLTNLKSLWLVYNQISDISAISKLKKLETACFYSQEIQCNINQGGKKEVELPQIIKAAKDINSKVYTDKDYILTNCTLSSDGTKIIIDTDNVNEASVDINSGWANGTLFCVIVNDKTPPKVEVKNSITTPTNQNVTVTITANEEVKTVTGWSISSDRKILSKKYTENKSETIDVIDLAGNKTTVNVKVDNIDKIAPKAEVKNSITTPTNQNVTVTITANEEIKPVSGWKLSTGKTILTKEYAKNGEETVEITDLAGNKTTANVKVDNIDKTAPIIEVKNSITSPTNGNVTVSITANEEVKTVTGWSISTDRKTLSKKYTTNKSETITVTDLAGNTTTASVKITNIDKTAPQIEVTNSITSPTNQNVTVSITANEEVKTVTGWSISSDRKTLSKKYTENKTETIDVIDLAGNKTTANIKVDNIDKTAPTVEVKNSITSLTNENVTVTITANEEIKEVPDWTLSSDKKVLTKVYTENKTETIEITDLAGNKTTAEVTVNNINKIGPKVAIKYSTVEITNQNVIVTITSDKEIQEVDGWTLSSDKKILTKTYNENKEETIQVIDLSGNKITVSVKISNIDKIAPNLNVKYSTVEKTNQNIIATITSDKEIQEVEGWTLDTSKRILTKEYKENGEETIVITDLAGNKATANIKIGNIDKTEPKVEVKNSITTLTNQNVVVTITANKEIREVSGWTLSNDKKRLTKTYTENKTETIVVTDLVGNTTTAAVVVNNINKVGPKATIKYSTVEKTNQSVIVTITSDKEIQEIDGWVLDSSKKILTKEYTANQEETIQITDLAGNTITAEVKIKNIDKIIPDATVKYSTVDPTNQNVIVTITTDKEIQEVEGWTLDSSKKVLTKEYAENKEEEIVIKDLAGNEIKVDIKIANIDKTKPEVNVSYSSTEPVNGKVKVVISVEGEIQVPEGWIYDKENSIIYKEYDANTEETVTIADLAGNEIKVEIIVDNIISSSSSNEDSTIKDNNVDNTISTIPIPKAGIRISILIAIIFMLVCGYVTYKKYGKYKDIK